MSYFTLHAAHGASGRRALAATVAVLALDAAAQPSLPPVTVTATRFAEPAQTLPFGVSVISAEQIARSGATTVNEAIMRLLGVVGRLDVTGGNNYSLDLRGFGTTADSNQVVIVDGLSMNEADMSSASLAAIPIATVHKIEILRGTGAVLYGEGATGGAIIITTKAGVGAARSSGAQLTGAVGNLGLREGRATATLAHEGFSFDLAASTRKSDGHRVNFASDANASGITAQWSNGWLRLGARTGRDATHSGMPGPLSAAQYLADPRQAASLTEYAAIQKAHSGLFLEAFAGGWQLAADAHRRSKHYETRTFGAPYAYAVEASNLSLRACREAVWGPVQHAFVVGYDNGNWDRTIQASIFTPAGTRAKAQSSAWYLRDDLTLSASGTRLSLGWRSEGLEKSEASSTTALNQRQRAWELGLSQPLGSGLTGYVRLGRSFRLANVDEFSFTNPGVPLQPQSSRDQELGMRWARQGTALEARWYRSALRNEIGYDPAGNGPFGPFGANVNFDATRRQGIELSLTQTVGPTLDLSLQAAVRQARFMAGPYAGNDVMLVPKQTLALRADWRPAPGHSLSSGVHWVSGQSPDFANRCRMPGYAIADLRYAYAWRNLELALGVANLGDRKYYTQAFGCTPAGVTTNIYPEAGRTFTASLAVQF